jgi:hypothetical protein
VNIASQMETNSDLEEINISEKIPMSWLKIL